MASPFGADDQHGMLNHVDEAKRVAALRLVRSGRLYDLGHELHEGVPVFPGRYFRQTLVTTAHHNNGAMTGSPPTGVGVNNVNWITEIVTGTMQLGTHLTRSAISRSAIGATTVGASRSWRRTGA